jgi:predicted ATPase
MAYRDNEFDGKEALGLSDDLSNGLIITELKVTNLDISDIRSMLIHLLHISSDSVEPLSNLILQKTDGNPHAIVNLLNFLARKELLIYSNETYSWKWNLARIETEVSDDPKEIIAKKILILDADTQEVLRLAAYIGHSFQLRVLFYSKFYGTSNSDMLNSNDYDTKMQSLRKMLESAIAIGLIEEVSLGKFRFLHDSYQDYLYHSVDSVADRGAIHLQVGRGIRRILNDSQEDRETLLVLAANNFIPSSNFITENAERLEILRLLYSAANTAASKISVNNACQFLSCGISLISESDWSTHYNLCIDLYNKNAEILSLAGSFEECNESVRIVLQRSRLQKDRLRAQYTKIRCLGYRNDVSGMLKYAFQNVLKNELGEVIPLRPSFARLAIEFARTRSEIKILKPENFLTLPEMTDATKVAVLHVFAITLPYMFTYSQSLYLYTILRQIRLSIKFGISPITASALASYALIAKSMGKLDVANQFEDIAMELTRKSITSFAARSISFAIAGFILPTRLHLYEIVDSMLESYAQGWKSNSDRSVAFYSITGYLEMQYYLGMPLAILEKEQKKYCQQMKEYQANQMWTANIILWQLTLNLLGQSNDPSILTGEVMNAKNLLEIAKRENDDLPLRSISFYQMILSFNFEDWDQLKDILPVTIKNLSKQRDYYHFLLLASQIVLAALSLYMKTCRRKYVSMARSHLKMIGRRFSEVPDGRPLLSLLNAEWAAIIDKKDATNEFDRAITELKEIRFVAFETIAYQSVMHMNLRDGNIRKAKSYLIQSIERNREWGNIAKVEWLESTYFSVLKSVKPFHEIKLIHNSNNRS